MVNGYDPGDQDGEEEAGEEYARTFTVKEAPVRMECVPELEQQDCQKR
jgi:hypothetical protein